MLEIVSSLHLVVGILYLFTSVREGNSLKATRLLIMGVLLFLCFFGGMSKVRDLETQKLIKACVTQEVVNED